MEEAVKLFVFRAEKHKFSYVEWLNFGHLAVYARKSRRHFGKSCLQCFDIASAECSVPGKGQFTEFLDCVHELNPWAAIYVENVYPKRFQSYFLKRGFAELPGVDSPKSYYILSNGVLK